MTGKKKQTLLKLEEKNSPQKVSLEQYYQYPIKGISESSYKLDPRTSMKMKEVLYVLGLKKNLLSISTLDKKRYRVVFIEEGGRYKLKGHPETTLVHETTCSSELWHRRLAHIN